MLTGTRKKGTVLIIEDEEHFRTYLESIVKRDYLYYSAGSWSSAKSFLYENDIDIVLVDLRLPGVSGKRIVETIYREFGERIQTIVITGYENDWEDQCALKCGVHSYFRKGAFRPEDLILVMDSCISFQNVVKSTSSSTYSGVGANSKTRLEKLEKLYDFTNKLTSLDNLNDVVDTIIKTIKNITGCMRISVMLLSDDDETLYIKKAIGIREDIIKSTRIRIGENIAGKAFHDRKIISSSSKSHLRDKYFKYQHSGPFMSVPLNEVPFKRGKKPIGVINLTNKKGGENFTVAEKNLLLYLANSASIAIKNELRKKALEKASIDTLILLTNVIEARDKYTQGHSIRVSQYASEIAHRLGFSDDSISEVRYGAQLHDIGKIEIPDAVLLKKGSLTIIEYDIMKKHPVTSKKIVDHIAFFDPIKGLFLHHHERFDGGGYPDGIKGRKIEIGARIIAVADAYDAMTSDRPYRKAMSKKVALNILHREKGKQFDPDFVDVFIDYLNTSN
jgi:response regulator RpfG family c-di-GMP phosphodiesterase